MDPDQFFISPIDNSYGLQELMPFTSKKNLIGLVQDMKHPAVVSPGVGVAQTYGLGSGWTMS